MEQSELLRFAVEALEKMGLRYFVTGSMATIFFGEPRFTNDIDIVVDPSRGSALRSLSVPGLLSERGDGPSGSFAARPVQHHPSDLRPQGGHDDSHRFALQQEPLRESKKIRPAPDFDAAFSSAEDVILKKMEAYREGGSEKHLRDIAGVLKINGAHLDRGYLEDWAERLGTAEIWREVLKRAAEG